MLEQGGAEEAADLLWECARKREPWALQALLQRLAPQTQRLKLTHQVQNEPAIDYTRLEDAEIEQMERLLLRATNPVTVRAGPVSMQSQSDSDDPLADPGAKNDVLEREC